MSVHFSDTVTARLEGYGRARGVDLGILKDRSNTAGSIMSAMMKGTVTVPIPT